MSEFPALRDALVAAGMRRRRRRRAIGAALPTLAVAAAAAAFVAFPHRPPDHEQAAPRPLSPLEQMFGVFRRPQRPEDRLPEKRTDQFSIDPAGSRQVGGSDSGFFVAPTLDGRSLCAMLESGGGYGGGCSRIADLRPDAALGPWMGSVYALLFRDGVRDVRLLREDGRRDAPRVIENGVVARSDHEFSGVSWTSASGTTRYVNRVGPAPKRGTDPSSCPQALDPLPRDGIERAIRAALIDVDQLYPRATSARVMSAAEGPRGLSPCPAAVTARAVVVGLRLLPKRAGGDAGRPHGRLLAGMQNGAMRVFYLLD